MKRIFLLSLLSLGLYLPVWTQTDCTDSVGISTNPLPGQAYNNEPGQPVNTFNWMNNPWPHNMFVSYSGQPPLQSPFDGNNTLNIGYLQKGLDSDFYPEDGWELVHWGMGKLVDGSNEQASGAHHTRELPCVVLYNRHSGMLHVFGASDFTESQVMQVELRLTPSPPFLGSRPGYVPSGLLAYASPIAQPLDVPTDISRVTSRSVNPNQVLKIFHAAFPIAYDPCVCQNKGALQVYFTRINEMSIQTYGRLGATSQSPEEYYDGNNNPDFPSWLSSVHQDGMNVVAGAHVHKNASDMYGAYQAEMQAAAKADVVSALGVLKAGLDVGIEIAGFVPGLGTVASALENADKLAKAIKTTSGALKVASKGVNYAQSQIKMRKANEPAKPATALPAIIYGEMTMSGTITDSTTKLATEFAVPGSMDSWTSPENNFANEPYYPLYNEELGVFALLETPVVERHRSTNTLWQQGSCAGGQKITIERISTYRLASPLKFAINRAARINLEASDLSAALVVKSPPEWDPSINYSHYERNATMINMEESVDGYTYITPFLPVNCLEDQTYLLNVAHTACEAMLAPQGLDVVYLRVANTYVSSTLGSDGLPIVSQQIITFPVELQEVGSPLPAPVSFPESLTVDGSHAAIDGSGNLVEDLGAWGNIVIQTDLKAPSVRYLRAGGSITVAPGVEIGPNIVLLPGSSTPFDCGSDNPPYSPAGLDTYCSSNKYQANQLSRLGQQYVENSTPSKIPKEIFLTLFPNPTAGTATLRYELPEKAAVSIEVRDLMGRLLMSATQSQPQAAGQHEQLLEVGHLAAGVYLVVFQTGKQQQTVRLVKE